MTRVACIHHLDEPVLGFAGDALRAAGIEIEERSLLNGHPLPEPGEVDGILTFGGLQSARDMEEIEYLREEAAVLRAAVSAGAPVMGICLGGQMLARALGGEVQRMPRTIIAWREVEAAPAAANDPLFSAWPQGTHTLHWHEDHFSLPPGGVELLSRGGPGVEAFRVGERAWGVQFHPEANADDYERWCQTADPAELEDAGVTVDDVRAAGREQMAAQERAARALFGAFARVVMERSRSRTGA